MRAEIKNRRDDFEKEISKIQAVDRLSHFSDIVKFLGHSENALRRLKEADIHLYDQSFVEAIMEQKLDGDLFAFVRSKDSNVTTFSDFKKKFVNGFKERLYAKCDKAHCRKISDCLEKYQEILDELVVYNNYLGSNMFPNNESKEEIQRNLIKLFYKKYQSILIINDISQGLIINLDIGLVRMMLLDKYL